MGHNGTPSCVVLNNKNFHFHHVIDLTCPTEETVIFTETGKESLHPKFVLVFYDFVVMEFCCKKSYFQSIGSGDENEFLRKGREWRRSFPGSPVSNLREKVRKTSPRPHQPAFPPLSFPSAWMPFLHSFSDHEDSTHSPNFCSNVPSSMKNPSKVPNS